MHQLKNFINGVFQEQPAETPYLDIRNPSTDEVFTQVPRSNEVDVENAYVSAKNAFPGWSTLPPSERSRLLLQVADAIEASLQEFGIKSK